MTVIVGSGQGKKKQWIPIVSIVAILVFAGVAGAGLRWWQNRDTATEPKEKTGTTRLPERVERIQDLAINGQYDTAQKEIAEALAKPGISSEEKYDLYFQRGIVYETEGNLQAALESYKQAESVRANRVVSEAIGNVAVQLNDKQLAIRYYEKVITQLDTNDPVYEADKEAYETKVRELKGQE
jgi:tetratricopeptide (TPR) repeat protein